MSSGNQPLDVFISYSHVDAGLKDELIKHLSPLKRRGLVRDWHDRKIQPGVDWATEIAAELETADVVLVLISNDFIHSDYCYEKEMLRAMERHSKGECRVVPVFLRACDWKGLPFGRIQGLPDDAIPVVSSKWGSQDEAFTRVVQGIRQIAENWGSIKSSSSTTPQPSASDARPHSSPATHPQIGEIADSGSGVLLGGDFFESESVTEEEGGRIIVRIPPTSPQQEARLRALKGEPPFHNSEISFAHGNEAFTARVVSARLSSTGGSRVWSVELEPTGRSRQLHDDISVNGIRPDEIATARARLLLLGEQPSGKMEEADMWIRNMVAREGEQEITGSVFPDLWLRSEGDAVKFLRWARLVAIHTLLSTKTCDHILDLKLRLEPSDGLFVKFTGERSTPYPEKIKISVEGIVPLNGPQNPRKPRR